MALRLGRPSRVVKGYSTVVHDPLVDELQVRINRLSGRTFEVARALVDGDAIAEEAAREAVVLRDAGRALIPSLKALSERAPEDAARLEAMLREALIEAQFAIAGGRGDPPERIKRAARGT
jgi:hypothetical protein